MWWKILLLTLYLSVLFVLSRILEAVAYYEGGYLSSRLLDPVSLSVRKLKAILDQRGVGYTGVVEQKQLTELVTTSGGVTDGELEVAVMALTDESAEVVSTNFTCGTHFYEEVEDTKDSVWVVQVVCDHHSLFMQHSNWKMFVKKVSRFGVRTGIFDCTLDKHLCERKKWYRSQLILALPQGYRAKDEVALKSYAQSSQHQAVFDWVNRNLASRISQAHSLTELSERWFRFKKKSGSEKIRVLLFSRMTIPPMFYSVLSVKFTGRVKFGIVDVNTRRGKLISSHLNLTGDDEVPTYMVLTPETNKTFGKGDGEYLNYQSMGLFLRTLHPEVNDIFLLSLIVINMACWLEFFIARGSLFKRLGRVLWDIVKWNFLLILLWLPVLGLFQLPYMDALFDHLLTALRVVGMTNFAGYVRSDWLWYSSVGWVFFVVTFLLFSFGVALAHYLYQGPEQPPSSETTSGFWSLQWESYFSNLFQPMASLARPTNPHAYSMELGMELLIERLAVPNLWLRPIISNQYIHELPVWKHQGPCTDSDIGSDSECLSLRAESDCEESAASGSEVPSGGGGGANGQREFGPKPLMFICEKCRVLQNNNAGAAKSAQELEEERAESESACAKYLMDGDYKCLCGHQDPGHRSPHRDQSKASSRTKAPPAPDEAAAAAAQGSDPHHQMPPGIIATMDCSICLESYKHEAVLCGLPCGHAFHQHCIMGWLNRDNHHCPICRWPAYKAKPCHAHLHSE